jgi:hypothetical protein
LAGGHSEVLGRRLRWADELQLRTAEVVVPGSQGPVDQLADGGEATRAGGEGGMSNIRYRVGCAGMFVLGRDWGYDDRDEALAACLTGPPGCECIDTWGKTTDERYIGPYCLEDHNAIADELGRPDLRLPEEKAA